MKTRFLLAGIAIALALALTPAPVFAQARSQCRANFGFTCTPTPPVKSYVGSGSGTLTSTDSADSSKACDDTDDCTTTLSGRIHVGGLGRGKFQATLTVAWKTGRISNVNEIACAAVVGGANFGPRRVGFLATISGQECETAQSSPGSPHTFSLAFFAPRESQFPFRTLISRTQATGTLTISDFGIDQTTGSGTYILDLRMAAQIFK
jgi:hypothetical protein